jgi:hypothetical protein
MPTSFIIGMPTEIGNPFFLKWMSSGFSFIGYHGILILNFFLSKSLFRAKPSRVRFTGFGPMLGFTLRAPYFT